MIKIVKTQKKGVQLSNYFNLKKEDQEFIYNIHINSLAELINNLDKIKSDPNLNSKTITYYCDSFETLLVLDEHDLIADNSDVYLVDDFENKDRSYIDTNILKHKIRLRLPISYVMWNVKVGDKIYYYSKTTKTEDNSDEKYGNWLQASGEINHTSFSQETILEINRIAEMMSQVNNGNLTEVEKVIILSSFFQANMQFVKEINTTVLGETFVVKDDNNEISPCGIGSADVSLIDHYGVCRSFADLTTLLGNNPHMNLNIRNVSGHSHAWNYIIIGGDCYYIDNTRAVSRNDFRQENALKATSFDPKHLLFGTDDAVLLNHEKQQSFVHRPVNKNSIDLGLIEAILENFYNNNLMAFDYSSVEPHFKSTKVQ